MNGENTAFEQGRPATGRLAKGTVWFGFSLLLILLILALAYPGAMTNDSVAWLSAGRSGLYSDAQSVVVQMLVGLLDRLLPGPMLFIALNVSLVVLGTTAIVFLTGQSRDASAFAVGRADPPGRPLAARSARDEPRPGRRPGPTQVRILQDVVASLLVLCYPLCLLPAVVAWRDITCLGLLTACAALVLVLVRQQERRRKLLILSICVLLALLSVLVKENAPAAFLPLLTWGFLGLARPARARSFRTLFACAAAALVLLTAGLWLSLRVTAGLARERPLARQPVVNYELALVSDRLGENLFPTEVFPDLTRERIRYFLDYYGVRAYWQGFWPAYSEPAHEIFPRITDDGPYRLLLARWRQAVSEHPLAYLGVRLKMVSAWWGDAGSLRRGFGVVDMKGALRPSSRGGIEVNFPTDRRPLPDKVLTGMASFAERCLPFHPLIYLGAAALLLLAAFVVRIPSRVPALVLWLSGLAHFLATAAVVPHWEFRFGYQAVFLAILSAVLCLRDLTQPAMWRR